MKLKALTKVLTTILIKDKVFLRNDIVELFTIEFIVLKVKTYGNGNYVKIYKLEDYMRLGWINKKFIDLLLFLNLA